MQHNEFEEKAGGEILISKVQISDLEDTVVVPPGKWLRGAFCGNAIWRSPESWCRGPQNQTSDVFSFGIVMIYVMTSEMVFRVPNEQLDAEDSWRYILRRHLSYFADVDSVHGFLDHIKPDNPFAQRIVDLVGTFKAGSDTARQPFKTHWVFVEPELRDLVGQMTVLDPKKRITSRQALQYSWFSQNA
ncbi:kinase-like domain-containing protein [Aspergillus californicus]